MEGFAHWMDFRKWRRSEKKGGHPDFWHGHLVDGRNINWDNKGNHILDDTFSLWHVDFEIPVRHSDSSSLEI